MTLPETKITSSFWKRYRQLVAKSSVPFQWEMINDQATVDVANDPFAAGGSSNESHAIKNLKIAAGREKGDFFGMDFQDTDVYKWLETAAYVLKYAPDAELKKHADQVVDLIADAQEDDGYLSTMFQIEMPERKFKRLQQSHELYSMGHYIEAGVAYYQVTQNKKALQIACKMADCLYKNFGTGKDQILGIPGHPEIELALCRLYDVTQQEKYLQLAHYFVTQRGQDPEFFDKQNAKDGKDRNFFPGLDKIGNRYYYSDKPVTDQQDVHGHAVRVLYFLTGLAHVARLTKSEDLLSAAKRLWRDVVNRQMYVTGNVGQTTTGEAFTYDYDLPNDVNYGETCASVALVRFAKQMEHTAFSGEYGDVIEKELFNGALSGISLDGKHYFYVNPLEADPQASRLSPEKNHIATRRASWFSCACCPSNITRLLASVDEYLYEVHDDTILSDQFIANETHFDNGVSVVLKSNFPWSGELHYDLKNTQQQTIKFGIRLPGWTHQAYTESTKNIADVGKVQDGILWFTIGQGEASIDIAFDMTPQLIRANPRVKSDIGKVAVQRGPIVYCVEGVDNPQMLWTYQLEDKPTFTYHFDSKLLDGVGVLSTSDVTTLEVTNSSKLYDRLPAHKVATKLTLVPYYSWANREESQMEVWIAHAGD